MNKLEYFINKDERGEFNADVRRDGKTIYEIKNFDDLNWLLYHFKIKHCEDIIGLENYLQDIGLLSLFDSKLVMGN